MQNSIKNKWLKLIIACIILLGLIGAITGWYFYNQKFDDTLNQEAAYNVNANNLITEFVKNDSLANKKYAEKIMVVNGKVAEFENVDSTVNVKMIDTISDAYIIFNFQQKNIEEVKKIKEGDSISIKGSCSGGVHSDILETESINFKRCAIIKK